MENFDKTKYSDSKEEYSNEIRDTTSPHLPLPESPSVTGDALIAQLATGTLVKKKDDPLENMKKEEKRNQLVNIYLDEDIYAEQMKKRFERMKNEQLEKVKDDQLDKEDTTKHENDDAEPEPELDDLMKRDLMKRRNGLAHKTFRCPKPPVTTTAPSGTNLTRNASVVRRKSVKNIDSPAGTNDTNTVSDRSPPFKHLTEELVAALEGVNLTRNNFTTEKAYNDFVAYKNAMNQAYDILQCPKLPATTSAPFEAILKINTPMVQSEFVKNTDSPNGTNDADIVSNGPSLYDPSPSTHQELIDSLARKLVYQKNYTIEDICNEYSTLKYGGRCLPIGAQYNLIRDLSDSVLFIQDVRAAKEDYLNNQKRDNAIKVPPELRHANNVAKDLDNGYTAQGGNNGVHHAYGNGHLMMGPNYPLNNIATQGFYTGYYTQGAPYYADYSPMMTFNNGYATQVGNNGAHVGPHGFPPLERAVDYEEDVLYQQTERPCLRNALAMRRTGVDPSMSMHRRM